MVKTFARQVLINAAQVPRTYAEAKCSSKYTYDGGGQKMETRIDGAHKSAYVVHMAADKRDAGTVGQKDTWGCSLPSSRVLWRVLSLQVLHCRNTGRRVHVCYV